MKKIQAKKTLQDASLKNKTLNIFCDNGHFGDFGNVAYFEMKLPGWHFCWMASSIKLPRLAATSCPSTPWSHRPDRSSNRPVGATVNKKNVKETLNKKQLSFEAA